MTIDDYIQKLDAFAEKFDIHIKDIVLNNKGKLLSTVKLRLYQKGIDANYMPLGEYSIYSIKRKKAKGQITSHITLRDTGDFYNSMFIDYANSEIIVDSNDKKASALEAMFGNAILGLTEEEVEVFVDSILQPQLQTKLDELGQDLDLGSI